MDDPRQRHGDHTWDLVAEYLCCPKCQHIIEDRQKYEYQNGSYQKEIICPSCGYRYTQAKKIKPRMTPLLGDPLKAS